MRKATLTAIILSIFFHAIIFLIPIQSFEKISISKIRRIRMKLPAPPPQPVETKKIEEASVEPPPPKVEEKKKEEIKKPKIEEVEPPPLAEAELPPKKEEAPEPPPSPETEEPIPEVNIELPVSGVENVKTKGEITSEATESEGTRFTVPKGTAPEHDVPGGTDSAIGRPLIGMSPGSKYGVQGGKGNGLVGGSGTILSPGSKYGVRGGKGKGTANEISLFMAMVRTKINRAKSYPKLARELGYQGIVGVRFLLMTDGSVRDIKVVRSCPYDVLNNSALDAIKSAAPFSQKPKELEGKEIPIEIDIRFRLE